MPDLTNPTNLSSSSSNGVVYLSWTNMDQYTHIRIYRNTTASLPAGYINRIKATTQYQDQPGSGTFYYWVQGEQYIPPWVDPTTGIRYPPVILLSDAVIFPAVTVTSPSVPSTPVLGTLSTSSVPMKITLPCSGGSGALGYKIERSLDNSTYTEIGTIAYTGSTVNYIDYDINPSTLYYYRIRAYNDFGNSGYSTVKSITSAAVTVPGTPSISLTAGNASIGVSITPGSDQSYPRAGFELAWGTSSGPTNYTSIGNTTNYTIVSLTNSTTYYVRCKQVDIKGNKSSPSTEQSATPSSGASVKPSAPGSATVRLINKGTIHISWGPSIPPSGEVIDYYFVGVVKVGEVTWASAMKAYGLDCTLDGRYDAGTGSRLGDFYTGVQYYCTIYSHSASGYSSYSPLVYFWIGPPAMGTISIDQLDRNTIRLKWTPLGGADLYIIERAEARQTSPGTWGSFSSFVPIATASANFDYQSSFLETFVDHVQDGVKYKWRITPYDKFGNTNTPQTTSEVIAGGQAISDPDWCNADEDWDQAGNPIIVITWGRGNVSPPRTISKYQITRKTSPSLPGTYIVDVDSTTNRFVDTGGSGLGSLTLNTRYYYGVRTKDDLGNVSTWEVSNAVIPRSPAPPPPPSDLVAYAQGTAATVTWSTSSDADAYILYRKPSGGSYAVQQNGFSSTLSAAASAGAVSITLSSYSGLVKGDFLYFEDSGKEEAVCITATVTGNPISASPLHYSHSSGVTVKRIFTHLNPKFTEIATKGSKIYYKARAINNYLLSDYSNEDYVIIGEPSRPLAQATAISGGNIQISWTKSTPGSESSTIDHYNFYWRISGGSWSGANSVLGTSVNLSSYTTVQKNLNYEFKVEAVDSAGLTSEMSPVVIFGLWKPNPATNLIAFAQQESGIWYAFVQWSAPEETTYPISYYKVYRKPEGGAYSVVAQPSTEIYKDPFSGLSSGTRYYYYVVAYDTQGLNSDNSNIDSLLIGEPERPTDVRAVIGDGQVTVFWATASQGSAPLDHYHVWMSTDGVIYSKVGDNLNADPNIGSVVNQFTKTGLTNGNNYYFKVSVIDKAGIESEYSETVQARPYIPPNPPRNPRATAGHLEIHITWDKPE